MPRRSFTEIGRCLWVPVIADPAKPTTAELSGPETVELTSALKRDGIQTPVTVNTIDVSDAGSLWNKSAPGTKGGDTITLNGWRDSRIEDDVLWTTMVDGAMGYLVVNRFGNAQDTKTGLGSGPSANPAVAPKEGDRLEVYECTVTSRAMDSISNDANACTISLTQTGVPQFDSVVAKAGGGDGKVAATVDKTV